MMILITFAAFCFWLHGQIRWGLRVRLLTSGLLIVCLIASMRYVSNTAAFYERGGVAGALETLTAGYEGDRKTEYRRMIETYKWDGTAGSSYLMEETRRLKAKYPDGPVER